MNNSRCYNNLVLLILFFLATFSMQMAFAQNKPKWYVTAGVGASTLRGLKTSFADLSFVISEHDAVLRYELDSKPSFLITGGLGLAGSFSENSLLGWDVGLNVRSAGFNLTPRLIEQQGEFSSPYQEALPKFGERKEFRYVALHLPLSISYLSFEYVGFKVGADLYYQASSNITRNEYPYGKLGETMGMLFSIYEPKYQHPFQLGAHVGLFAPINDRLRLDLDLFSDISPRLQINTVNPGLLGFNFREMGIKLNARYNIKW